MKNQTSTNQSGNVHGNRIDSSMDAGIDGHILSEHLFNKIVRMEEKRARRSQRSFILLVLDAESVRNQEDRRDALVELAAVLPGTLRHTDVTGWYEKDSSLAILMTEIGKTKPNVARQKVTSKIAEALGQNGFRWADAINVTARVLGNGTGSSVETTVLGHVLGNRGGMGGAVSQRSPRRQNAQSGYLREFFFVGCDALLVMLSSLFVLWLDPIAKYPLDERLLHNTCLSLLILLTVSFLFGFYRIEVLWLAKNKLRQLAVSTGTILGVSLLWSVFAPQFLFGPVVFLEQMLVVWLLSLFWKYAYLKYYLKSEVNRVLSVQHHNVA